MASVTRLAVITGLLAAGVNAAAKTIKQGDMELTRRQFAQKRIDDDQAGEMSEAAQQFLRAPLTFWKGHVAGSRYRIAYKFDEKSYGDNLKDAKEGARAAMDMLYKYTALEFQEWGKTNSWKHKYWMEFYAGSGCHSQLGRVTKKGGQRISAGPGCFDLNVMIHEIIHALGWDHEQTRKDRDDHIEIIWKNIPENVRNQFQKDQRTMIAGGAVYDLQSVMHYYWNEFGIDSSKATMVSKDKSKKIHNGPGKDPPQGVSDLDVYEINTIYNMTAVCAKQKKRWTFWDATNKKALMKKKSHTDRNTCLNADGSTSGGSNSSNSNSQSNNNNSNDQGTNNGSSDSSTPKPNGNGDSSNNGQGTNNGGSDTSTPKPNGNGNSNDNGGSNTNNGDGNQNTDGSGNQTNDYGNGQDYSSNGKDYTDVSTDESSSETVAQRKKRNADTDIDYDYDYNFDVADSYYDANAMKAWDDSDDWDPEWGQMYDFNENDEVYDDESNEKYDGFFDEFAKVLGKKAKGGSFDFDNFTMDEWDYDYSDYDDGNDDSSKDTGSTGSCKTPIDGVINPADKTIRPFKESKKCATGEGEKIKSKIHWKDCESAKSEWKEWTFKKEKDQDWGYIRAANHSDRCWSILNTGRAWKQTVFLKRCKGQLRQRFVLKDGRIYLAYKGPNNDKDFCVAFEEGEQLRTRKCFYQQLGGK